MAVLNKRKEDEELNTELTRTDIIKCIQSEKVRFRGVNLSGLDLSKLVYLQEYLSELVMLPQPLCSFISTLIVLCTRGVTRVSFIKGLLPRASCLFLVESWTHTYYKAHFRMAVVIESVAMSIRAYPFSKWFFFWKLIRVLPSR